LILSPPRSRSDQPSCWDSLARFSYSDLLNSPQALFWTWLTTI
jgi:hypothetical protein